jgi:hypothetical protein
MDSLHKVSEALIIWETLDGEQINQLMDGIDIGVPTISDEPKVAKKEASEEVKEDEKTDTPDVDVKSEADPDPTLA